MIRILIAVSAACFFASGSGINVILRLALFLIINKRLYKFGIFPKCLKSKVISCLNLLLHIENQNSK